MRILQLWIILVFGIVYVEPIFAQQTVPKLDARVTDFTNTLSYTEWTALEKLLKEFEDTTSTQIVVLLVGTVEGGSIEDFAVRVFEQNAIGQAKKNNGVLVLVAKEDRAIRIEVGYGLEGVLTDALTNQIVDKEMVPKFREGAYFAGIVSGLDAVMKATAGEYTADPRGKNAPAISGGLVMSAVLFFIFVLLPAIRSRRGTHIGSRGSNYYSGWGYGSGSSGSFGGGSSFGGFSGGGGMSGGGGATGRW
jgi:uncharacterized protein